MMPSANANVRNDTALVHRFVDMFADYRPSDLITDLQTTVSLAQLASLSFPVTVNDASQTPNCYLCSPTRAYVDYAIDETRNFAQNPVLHHGLTALIRVCAPLVRATGLDSQVQVNNWLFSTNPMPELCNEAAKALCDNLVTEHPKRAVIIRSLNDIADATTIRALSHAGFILLPSRQIYIVAGDASLTRNMKADRSKLRQSGLDIVGNADFITADYARCEHLYNMLYLQKYTVLNPHYSALYIQEMHRRHILKLVGLRNSDGILVAVTGLFQNGKTLTQPIVGYDTSLPMQQGLYRMIMAIGQDYAFEHQLFFNMSAGAGAFKRRRAAMPVIEYSAVFVKHLPLRQRIATHLLTRLLRNIGIPLLQRFEL